jgi:hypothetical protein
MASDSELQTESSLGRNTLFSVVLPERSENSEVIDPDLQCKKHGIHEHVFTLKAIIDLQDKEYIHFPYVPLSCEIFKIFQYEVEHSIPIKFYIYLKFLIKQAAEPDNKQLTDRVVHVRAVFKKFYDFDSLIKSRIKSKNAFDKTIKHLLLNAFYSTPFIGIKNCLQNIKFLHTKISVLITKLLSKDNMLCKQTKLDGFSFKKFSD